MKIETRQVLIADAGKILTNGNTQGTVIWLGPDDSVDNWTEVEQTIENNLGE